MFCLSLPNQHQCESVLSCRKAFDVVHQPIRLHKFRAASLAGGMNLQMRYDDAFSGALASRLVTHCSIGAPIVVNFTMVSGW